MDESSNDHAERRRRKQPAGHDPSRGRQRYAGRRTWPILALALAGGCPELDPDTDPSATASASSSDNATISGSGSAGSTMVDTADPSGDPTEPTMGPTTGSTTSNTATTAQSASTADTDTTSTTDGATSDTSGGSTTGSSTTGGSTTGGSTSDGSTTGGSTSDGTTTTGSTSDGTTTGGDIEPYFPPCDELAIGEPLTFDDLSQASSRRTPAPLAWDGEDLVAVRDDWNEGSKHCEIVFERRSPTGELLAPGLRSDSKGNCQNNGSLAYNPGSDRYLFTQQVGLFVGLVGLDSKGTILWEKKEWDVCNSLTETIDVVPRGDGFMVMGEQHSCSNVAPRHTSAAYYAPDGVREYLLKTAKSTGASGDAACDLPACDRLLTIRFGLENDISGTYAQMGDLGLGKLDLTKTKLNGSSYGGWHASGAAWNGEDWLTVRIEKPGPSHRAHVRRWDEDLGWTTSDTYFNSGGIPTEIELLWTGHDYVVVYAEWPYNGKGLPDDWYDLNIHYVLISADGAIKQHKVFERSLGYGGHSPQIVALPGSIGLSWVRVSKQGNLTTFSRHLSMIECAG